MPVSLKFKSDLDGVDSFIQVDFTLDGYLFLNIGSEGDGWKDQSIFLNKQSAIKFAKEVRKQISFMEEDSHE